MSRLFDTLGGDDDSVALPPAPVGDAKTPIIVQQPSSALIDTSDFGNLPDAASVPVHQESVLAATLDDHYDIPDFEKDERELNAYEDAKARHLRQSISSAETAIQATFKSKRDQLSAEAKTARIFEEERRASAMHTTRMYANAYPHRVAKSGLSRPSFWENIFSFGRAGKLYRDASLATEALEQLRVAIRKREEHLDALESQLNRALYLKEEQIKKSLETDAGVHEFNVGPGVAGLYERVERIRAEREAYAKRLEAGKVGDEEQRDRSMAEHKMVFAESPIAGAIIVRVARFGRLSYFHLRDIVRKEMLLSYDPRVDGLRNSVFDVYPVAGSLAAKLKRNDNGTAFRVADHFKVCFRNQDQAEELYGQHRGALREDRGLPAMEPRTEAEAELIEKLAALASAVDGGARSDGSGG